jgi:hypothetical protein
MTTKKTVEQAPAAAATAVINVKHRSDNKKQQVNQKKALYYL